MDDNVPVVVPSYEALVLFLDLLRLRLAYIADELGDHGEWLGGVDCHARSQECRIAHSVAVEVTSISIAEGRISCANSTISAAAASLLSHTARMWGVGRTDRIRFPNVHLITARSVCSKTSIGIVAVWCPSNRISLTKLAGSKADIRFEHFVQFH